MKRPIGVGLLVDVQEFTLVSRAAASNLKNHVKTSSTDSETGLVFQHVARQRMRLFDQKLAPHGLTSAQVLLLNWLFKQDGRSQIELARLLGIGTVAVSGVVDRLEANDWVERRPDPNDRRTKRVWLKPSAASKRSILSDVTNEVNGQTFTGLSEDEKEFLLAMMRRIRTNLKEGLGGEDVPV